jgi:DNA-binding response OmpR family regulator
MVGPGGAGIPAADSHKDPAEARRVVVVDDEPELRRVLVEYLTKHGFLVRAASGGTELDALLANDAADMLILDINMPGENGISIARRIHAVSATPILMLTAADAVVDRVVGLEIGADDYMTKPFDLRELLARVRAILRRAERGGTAPPVPPGRSPSSVRGVRFGRLTLDLDSRCLISETGASVELTAMEFDLLHVFAQNPNRVLTRDRLLDLAHNRATEPFDRSIDIRIARIRRKVEQDPAKP